MRFPSLLSLWLLVVTPACCLAGQPLFSIESIRDTDSLQTTVMHDWQADPREPAVRQKLIEITVCEWWPGQEVRLPVTLCAPSNGTVCKNILVANQSLAKKTGRLSREQQDLIKNDSVGVVLIGMGTIDAMQPVGQLHHGMRQQLLKTKDVRYTPAWIWGISQMRALTAATTEPSVFQVHKVLATGGSKRGIASAVAGIYDDRFTAIMPVVAPPLGNPGGPYVLGTEDKTTTQTNKDFFADLAEGKLGLPDSAEASLQARAKRRSDIRVTLEQVRRSNWSDQDIADITDRVWDASRVVDHLPELKERGLQIFYNVGTNDSVTPALLDLGRRFPGFPICIVPGGQHGGPADAGYTRRVPQQDVVKDNFTSFAKMHFSGVRGMIAAPQVSERWDPKKLSLHLSLIFPDGTQPQKNEVWWNLDRSEPYTLPFEYDMWTAFPMQAGRSGTYHADLTFSKRPARIDYVTLHTHTENELPITVSSAYRRVDLGK